MPAFQLPASFRRRATALTAAALAVVTLGACGDDDPTGNSGNLPGTYKLATVDGRPLPIFTDCGSADVATCTASQPEWDRLDEVLITLTGNGSSGTMSLKISGTDRFNNEPPESGSVAFAGNYTASGGNVTFTGSAFPGSLTVSHVGDELRGMLDFDADFDDDVVVFKKQP